MEKNELSDLIDQHLLGRIQPQDAARLEYLRRTDPGIDHEVESGKEVIHVLRYLRYKELRAKLQKLDAEESTHGKKRITFVNIYSILITFILLLGIGVWSWHQYQPATLALRYFHQWSASPEIIMLLKEDELLHWNEANTAMEQKQFDEVIAQLESFSESNVKEISYAAQWNILLARFALNGFNTSWKEDLIHFESTASQPFKGKAMTLHQTIDSPLYRFFIRSMSTQITPFKPRLM